MKQNEETDTSKAWETMRNTMRETLRSQWGHQQLHRARFGQRGWLRPAIIQILEKKPSNGMEMINEFAEASHGWWRPSPGSVYPLLETLETEGLIKKRKDGRYEVTQKLRKDSGQTGQADEMLTNMEGIVSYLEDMSRGRKAKLSAYRDRIKRITERLSKLR